MALQELCISAAERYYNFLEENDLGLIELALRDRSLISEALWKLVLDRRIFDVDTIQLKVRGQIYQTQEGGHFSVDSYDDETRVLIIKIRQTIPGFDDAALNEIKVVCNLRFLVKRVQNWFSANGRECRFPERAQSEPLQSIPPLLALSSEQKDAFQTVLESPCSYIWGPPGTGKTRYVLTSAVITRVLQGQRVAILAPTNLALDLAMRSVLEACDRLKADGCMTTPQAAALDREHFLRLGVPSRDFADDFQEVCEERGLCHQIATLEHRVAVLQMVVRYRRNRDSLQNIDLVVGLLDRVQGLLDKRNKMILLRENLRQRICSLEKELNSTLTKLTGWLTGTTQKKTEALDQCRPQSAALNGQIAEVESQFSAFIDQIGNQQTGSRLLDELYQQMAKLRVFDEDAAPRLASFRLRLSEIRTKTLHFIAAAEAHNAAYTALSLQEVERERDRVMKEIEDLLKRVTEERLRNARVLGCTIDVFIGRFCSSVAPVNHIFLDEACYTPVIKALTLFRRNIPVTFLGDHKQLPPVCEMTDEEMQQQENQLCVLWVRSAIFSKYLLAPQFPPISSLFEHLEEPPPAGRIDRKVLTETYRFGQNLASLLDELFYGNIGFKSVAGDAAALSVQLVSVPRVDGDRSNQNECDAVLTWIGEHGTNGTAILTPYRKQVAKLCGTLPRQLHDDVSTVHRSQGREWETVVFSAADTMQAPFLTDTSIPKGKLVMNTAISRAKRAIVLVCDAEYWSHRHDSDRQLISRLIRMAKD